MAAAAAAAAGRVGCRKFASTFENERESLDPKHVKHKFKALLQKAANRELETCVFCEREKAMPDQDIMEDVQFTKIAMQQAVEQMIVDVETNASIKTTNGITGAEAERPEVDASRERAHGDPCAALDG